MWYYFKQKYNPPIDSSSTTIEDNSNVKDSSSATIDDISDLTKNKILNGKDSNSTTIDDKSNLRNIEPLDEKDFVVTDDTDIISLDMPYKSFKTSKQEIEKENNFVGNVTSGKYVYKYYFHEYDDFLIYVSNANYNLKNGNIDDRYITQITLKNLNFKTKRGISVGQTLSDVVSVYGDGNIEKTEDATTLSYIYKDRELAFTIDQDNKITEISLFIIVNN